MRLYQVVCICCVTILFAACTPAATADTPPPNATQSLPTPSEPSGTDMQNTSSGLVLSHPVFNWYVELPAEWIVAYDAGFQLIANNPDQVIFMRIQAQRWKSPEQRLPDAKAYVDFWKNTAYGNVFPVYADGEQVLEQEIGQTKSGGPYLLYEFSDSTKGIHYLQVYASAGGPSSVVITTWSRDEDYEKAQSVMQTILDSFELVEEK